ncbi:MAG: hypothetical protein HY710_13595, partial [Candidatus Latescibacteria bacterium]|nr:hypothetical protein [Candidatus Latescibacterota bacterium]
HTADRIGVAPTLELLAFVPIAGALLALLLPGQAQSLEAEPATVRRPMSAPVLPQTVEKG